MCSGRPEAPARNGGGVDQAIPRELLNQVLILRTPQIRSGQEHGNVRNELNAPSSASGCYATELADLLKELSLSGLLISSLLVLSAFTEQMAGSLQQLHFPLALLDRVDGMVRCDLLKGLADEDRFHGLTGP